MSNFSKDNKVDVPQFVFEKLALIKSHIANLNVTFNVYKDDLSLSDLELMVVKLSDIELVVTALHDKTRSHRDMREEQAFNDFQGHNRDDKERDILSP